MTVKTPLVDAQSIRDLEVAQIWDVREEQAYLSGHWPGAVWLDVKRWESLARSADHGLDQKAAWEKEISRFGVSSAVPVLIYDDGRMTEAARIWFILQLYGVDARVIDGGWKALISVLPTSGHEVDAHYPVATTFRTPDNYVPTVKLVNRELLRETLLGKVQILDARTPAEYAGTDLRSNSRGGHLPGAKSVPHSGLLNENGTLKDAEHLRAGLEGADLDLNTPLVTHCDAGGRAALAALAAVAAGHHDVSAYYLSYSDWAADNSCSITLD
jgi:thiosulfate/3-mercaptopyruvate sulfurtransferase